MCETSFINIDTTWFKIYLTTYYTSGLGEVCILFALENYIQAQLLWMSSLGEICDLLEFCEFGGVWELQEICGLHEIGSLQLIFSLEQICGLREICEGFEEFWATIVCTRMEEFEGTITISFNSSTSIGDDRI